MGIYEKLAHIDRLPMHMPGHKRNVDAFPWLSGTAERDITEIEGFDDLNHPGAEFSDMESAASRLWGADHTVALVGGSTLGILASVLSALEGGGELLMCRDSHLSVYHAAQLSGARTRYLAPPRDPETGLSLSVTPELVSEALDMYPAVACVCVTSPTYEGVISDIGGIAGECHRRNIPLLVDEAHGAHLGLPGFPEGAVSRGADMVVQSLHKTLPALTQTALLHSRRGIVDPERLRRYVAMLQTSSPSYLLSSSIEKCVEYLALHGGEAAGRWLGALEGFYRGAGELGRIHLWSPDRGVFARDPSKLAIISPPGLGDMLRREFLIEPEYSRGAVTLCMTGMGDTEETLGRLLDALLRLDGRVSAAPPPPPALPERLPYQATDIRTALSLPGGLVPVSQALGRVSGEYVWRYPPGVPFLVPGETIDEAVLEALRVAEEPRFSRKHGGDLIFCVDLP